MRLIFALIGMMVAVTFAVQNAAPVAIKVFFWQLEASLAIVVTVCFALGAIVAGIAVIPEIYKRRSGERRLQAKLASLEAERPSTQAASVTPDDARQPR